MVFNWLSINGTQVKRVGRFKYLGINMKENLDPEVEIKCRIEMARETFSKRDDTLSLEIWEEMTECYVRSVLLYGVETRMLNIGTMNRLEAFEIWPHRRVLRITWLQHVTNKQFLQRANKDED